MDSEFEPEVNQVVLLHFFLVLIGIKYTFDALLFSEEGELTPVLVGEDLAAVDDLAVHCRIVCDEAYDVVVRGFVETRHH